MDDSSLRRENYSLAKVSTETWDGHIFLHFGVKPAALADRLGDLPSKFAAWKMGELRLARRTV